tara:strand:+ start:3255 stop:4193 length:939 start_codon:yes stop_codon:yes gene_type:complete
MYKKTMISNIDKVVQQSKIQEKKDKYYTLKNEFDSLPERIKKVEMQYYQEGGCNLNDDTDRTRCGMEYYLDIKREERKKAFESFANYSNQNEEEAEELSSVGFFDTIGLTKLFNKTVEGMSLDSDDKCDWDTNTDAFQRCEPSDDNNVKACKYNQEIDNLINDDYIHRKMIEERVQQQSYNSKINEKIANTGELLDKGTRENIRKGMVDYRHATFYDKKSDTYRNTIDVLNTIYWIVFVSLVVFFIYNKHYEIEQTGYLVLLVFSIIPFVLKPFVKLIMLYAKRYHFIDTLYTIIATGTVGLIGFLYYITSN